MEQPEDRLLNAEGIQQYQALVGAVLYVSRVTRWDISYAVNQLARCWSKPARAHLTKAKHLLRYFKGKPDLPLVYKAGNFQLKVYSDASFGAEPNKCRSTSGFLVMFCGAPISWASTLQKLIARSTVEAELIDLAYAAREAVYVARILTELGYGSHFESVSLWGDNTGSLSLAANAGYSARTKHCAIRYHFLSELVASGKLSMHHVPSAYQLSDILTKFLSKASFDRLVEKITNYAI